MNKKKANVLCMCVDISFLKEKCLNLENFVKHDHSLHIDGFDLISELNILRELQVWKMINQLTFLII